MYIVWYCCFIRFFGRGEYFKLILVILIWVISRMDDLLNVWDGGWEWIDEKFGRCVYYKFEFIIDS